MKNSTECAKKFKTLLNQKLAGAPTELPETLVGGDDPMGVFVQSFLLYDATIEQASTAFAKLEKSVVDFNELRVTMAPEMAAIIGTRYPDAEDRTQRLRAALRAVYLLEHDMHFKSHEGMTKRDVRAYFDGLHGIHPYVAARVSLLCYKASALPVDDALRSRLVEAGALDSECSLAEANTWVTKQVKAPDALKAHLALQAWIDEVGAAPAPKKPAPRKKTAPKKSSTAEKKPSASKGAVAKKVTKKVAKKSASKAPAKKVSKKTSAAKSSAKPAAKKSTGKKAPARKTAAKKAPAKKSSSKKAPSKKKTSKTSAKSSGKKTTKKTAARG